MGTTLAIFNCSGKIPLVSDSFNMSETVGVGAPSQIKNGRYVGGVEFSGDSEYEGRKF